MSMTSALLLGGCIERSEEPQLGDTTFVPGAPVASTSTTPAAPTPAAGGAVPVAPPATSTGDAMAPGTGVGVGSPAPGTAPADGTEPMGTAGAAAPTPDTETPGPAGDTADPVDTGAVDMSTGTPNTPASSAPGTLTVTVMTKASGGRYAPRNIGAIWVETGSGQFVKTLERWAGIRAADLRAWTAASGGWGFSFFGLGGTSPDQVDAITAATLRTHQQHMVSWDMVDNDGQVVPDGPYVVKVEVSDDRSVVGQAQFDKGATPIDLSPTGESWTNLTLSYQP